MDEDSKGQRKMEDSGGGLLPAVEGQPRIEQNSFDPSITMSIMEKKKR